MMLFCKTCRSREHTVYRIVGKFGGENVWRIYSFQAFGRKSLANE